MSDTLAIEGHSALLQAIEESGEYGSHALLIIGFSGIERVNIRLGYEGGDRVLDELCARVATVARNEDCVHRLKADQVALLVRRARGQGHAMLAARKIVAAIAEPMGVIGTEVTVHAHVGIGILPQHATNADDLLTVAEQAMRRAKRLENSVLLAPSLHDNIGRHEMPVEFDLDDAIEAGQLFMEYQPIINLGCQRIVSAEGLLRWRSPEYGKVLPTSFIPLVEHTGRIHDLTRHVLNIALRDLNAICDVTDDVSVSINASPRNLRDEDFDAVIADAMAVWGIDATRLIIEVTESALMNDPEVALKTLRRLCDMGLRVAIDDFGTGYSNMTYLRDLPAWELKIDQSFIRGICRDEKDMKIVSSIIQLAHALDLKVVAEGIETQDVADAVTELGCDLGQGYLYGRPVAIEDFIGTLNAQNPELSRK